MRAYEIEGWLDGVKIRLKMWSEGEFVYFNGAHWIDNLSKKVDLFSEGIDLFGDDGWEVFKESKKPEKVTLYRYTYQYYGEEIDKRIVIEDEEYTNLSWEEYCKEIITADTMENLELLKTETKEIEI